MNKTAIANWNDLKDRSPEYALVADVDLVVIRFDDSVSVLYGRCAHRGALMSDGHVDGDNLICGVHGWDYRLDSGISEYNNAETLHRFNAWVEGDEVLVDEMKSQTGPPATRNPTIVTVTRGSTRTPPAPLMSLMSSSSESLLARG